MTRDWTKAEVDAIVADYFDMLQAELRGGSFNKSEHRRGVAPKLDDRTDGSIERKHQNTSAVLIGLGLPYISGYKPLGNYQTLLAHEVERFVDTHPQFLHVVQADVDRLADVPALADILGALVEAPSDSDFAPGVMLDAPATYRTQSGRTDYLQREMSNASLGLAGERFVLEFEQRRLSRIGDGGLADRIEHVSQTQGDWPGFDIRSFDDAGADLFIEVKTTRYGKQTPFYISANQLAFSREKRSSYGLYRVFEFRAKPKLFIMPGAVDERCALYPTVYRAHAQQAI